MNELEYGLPKPLHELTIQEIKALVALTKDAIFDELRDLRILRERHEALVDELIKRND
jgi:hypothetical protein